MASKAEELMAKADKKAAKKGLLGGLFGGGSDRYEEARDMYEAAANQYKKVQDFKGASAAWMKCYEMDVKLKNEMEQIASLTEAAKCFRKFSNEKAVDTMKIALELLDKQSRYDKAAKMCMDAAGMLEKTVFEGPSNLEEEQAELLFWYEKARDYYKLMRNGGTYANDVAAKIAEVKIIQDRFADAQEIYDGLGRHCVEDNLLRFNAKGHFFMALLCELGQARSGDDAGIDKFRSLFETYQELDLQFNDATHEHIFCTKVVKAFEEGDLEMYIEAYRNFTRIIALDRKKEKLVMLGRRILKTDDQC